MTSILTDQVISFIYYSANPASTLFFQLPQSTTGLNESFNSDQLHKCGGTSVPRGRCSTLHPRGIVVLFDAHMPGQPVAARAKQFARRRADQVTVGHLRCPSMNFARCVAMGQFMEGPEIAKSSFKCEQACVLNVDQFPLQIMR